MEKFVLPDGVTIEGQREVYTEEQIRGNTEVYQKQINPNNRRRNGKTKHYVKPPSKLQRVLETEIYNDDQLKGYEMEQYRNAFREYIKKNYVYGGLGPLTFCAFAVSDMPENNHGITKILNEIGKGQKRTKSKIVAKNLSFHLSSFWRNKKYASLFVDRFPGKSFSYAMTEFGLKLGPETLVRVLNDTVPMNFEKLRLSLSPVRLAAKSVGISEDEFNEFIKTRHALIYNKKPVKKIEKKPEKDEKPIDSWYAPKEIESKDFTRIVETTTIDEIEAAEPVEKTLPPTVSEIELDLKIWFVPVTGTIRIK